MGLTPPETMYQSFIHVILVSYTTRNPALVFYARYLRVIHHHKPCTSLLRTLFVGHTPPETLYQSFMHVI